MTEDELALEVRTLSSPDDLEEVARLAVDAFGEQAMPRERVAELHGNFGESVFLLSERMSARVLGHLALFFPTDETRNSMLKGIAEIDRWTRESFLTGDDRWSADWIYFDSFVVLDPDPVGRRLKSRTLQLHVVRLLLAELQKTGRESVGLLGYSEPMDHGAEPGAGVMRQRLHMTLVPGATAHRMQLYSGRVTVNHLASLSKTLDAEIGELRAVSELR